MASLQDVLTAELGLVERFVSVLQVEQEAVKNAQTGSLEQITQDKNQLADQLNAISRERNNLLNAAGFAADREGMNQWLAAHGQASDRVTRQWTQLLDLAKEARELNRINGQLIALHLNVTQKALEAVNLRQANTSLYGRNGQAAYSTGHRIIDSA